MQGLDLNPFFFAKNYDLLTILNKCRDFGRCFGLNLFEKFFAKIVIFCTFDHWSEILSLSAGRPISQGVCPPLVGGLGWAVLSKYTSYHPPWWGANPLQGPSEGVGPETRDFFGLWNGNERNSCNFKNRKSLDFDRGTIEHLSVCARIVKYGVDYF